MEKRELIVYDVMKTGHSSRMGTMIDAFTREGITDYQVIPIHQFSEVMTKREFRQVFDLIETPVTAKRAAMVTDVFEAAWHEPALLTVLVVVEYRDEKPVKATNSAGDLGMFKSRDMRVRELNMALQQLWDAQADEDDNVI